jgi:hypothetical protein
MLCKSATKVNPPPIWKELANVKKKEAVAGGFVLGVLGRNAGAV